MRPFEDEANMVDPAGGDEDDGITADLLEWRMADLMLHAHEEQATHLAHLRGTEVRGH